MSTAEQRFSHDPDNGERGRRERRHTGSPPKRQRTELSVTVRAAEISESELEPHIIRGRE